MGIFCNQYVDKGTIIFKLLENTYLCFEYNSLLSNQNFPSNINHNKITIIKKLDYHNAKQVLNANIYILQ